MDIVELMRKREVGEFGKKGGICPFCLGKAEYRFVDGYIVFWCPECKIVYEINKDGYVIPLF